MSRFSIRYCFNNRTGKVISEVFRAATEMSCYLLLEYPRKNLYGLWRAQGVRFSREFAGVIGTVRRRLSGIGKGVTRLYNLQDGAGTFNRSFQHGLLLQISSTIVLLLKIIR